MAEEQHWQRDLLSQLATRNTLQDAFFRDVLTVHGQTASDERQFRRVAQTAPPSEVHHAVLVENADLQRRLQEVEQRAETLLAENERLKSKLMVRALPRAACRRDQLNSGVCVDRQESKLRDAETLNELTGNLEYYRQREVSDAAAASSAAPAVPVPSLAAPASGDGDTGSGQAGSASQEPPLPPIVGMVEIVDTGSGFDEYTGQEYTTYVIRCTSGATNEGQTAGASSVPVGTHPTDGMPDDASATPSPTIAENWTVSKRFSDFNNLRAELAALPTIGAVVETMDFPPSTWNFLPWGVGKLDEVWRSVPRLHASST